MRVFVRGSIDFDLQSRNEKPDFSRAHRNDALSGRIDLDRAKSGLSDDGLRRRKRLRGVSQFAHFAHHAGGCARDDY